jgi:ABC-type spermidine/putrescine transport system permease subunit II
MSTTTSTTGSGTVQKTSGGLLVNVSKKFTLVWNDFLKAFFVAALTTPLTELLTSVQSGNLKPNWVALGTVAITSGASYLLKNFFSTTATVVPPTPANVAAAK